MSGLFHLSWNARKRLKKALARCNLILLNYGEPDRRHALELVRRVAREVNLGIDFIEGCQLFLAVRESAKTQGDIAEVGVFMGGSSKIICEAKGDRPLHLFDTFEGIPRVSAIDTPNFQKGDWAGSLEAVQHYLESYPGVHFHKGVFPESAVPVQRVRFSFVHLDVDTYPSTRDCLEFFYPRLNPGGMILSHDYSWAAGVRKAFDEFFHDKPDPVLQLQGSQCLVVKVSSPPDIDHDRA